MGGGRGIGEGLGSAPSGKRLQTQKPNLNDFF